MGLWRSLVCHLGEPGMSFGQDALVVAVPLLNGMSSFPQTHKIANIDFMLSNVLSMDTPTALLAPELPQRDTEM